MLNQRPAKTAVEGQYGVEMGSLLERLWQAEPALRMKAEGTTLLPPSDSTLLALSTGALSSPFVSHLHTRFTHGPRKNSSLSPPGIYPRYPLLSQL